MLWTQYFVFISILANLQDAQSESQGLEEYLSIGLKQEIDEMVSDCDVIKNDDDVKEDWNTLVTLATSKTIVSLENLLSKETTPLPKFSDDEEAIEYFQQSGALEEFEKDLAQTYSALETFCSLQTGPSVKPRSAAAFGVAVKASAAKILPKVSNEFIRAGPRVGRFVENVVTDVAGQGAYDALKHLFG